MKTIIRFEEDDLRELVARKLNVLVDELISIYSEEVNSYDQGEHSTPVFYIEYESEEN